MVRTIALMAVVTVISLLLAAPAALYAFQRPTTTNVVSLVFTIGFFFSIHLLIRNRWVSIALGFVVLILNLVEIVHLVAFGGLISLGGLEAILYVNPHEAREFVGDHALAIAGGALIGPIFVFLVWARGRLDRLSLRPRLIGAATALVVPAGVLTGQLAVTGSPDDVYLPTRIFEHYVAYLGANPLTNSISGLATTLAARGEMRAQREARAAVRFDVVRQPPAARELYVVVIGESSRRRNWGLYGYGRDTTPLLRGQSGLTVFRDAVSPATVTDRSVPQSFYFPSAARDGKSQMTNSFVSAFRAAGFKTFWVSNQGTHRTAVGGQINLLMAEAEAVASTNYGFWNSVLDVALLAEIDRVIRDPAERKLLVVHTLGSHTNYRQRYPADWAATPLVPAAADVHTFSGLSAADAEIVDDYDRTITYTDWFLHEVIARLRSADQYGGMVYFSDHGQRVFDDASHAKGHGFGDFKPLDVEIPLLVWLSPEFERVSPAKRDAVVGNACKPTSTVDVAASMLDLAGIGVAQIEPTPSFVRPTYDGRPRRVLMTDDRSVSYDDGAPSGARSVVCATATAGGEAGAAEPSLVR